jgi:hypothetical protein
MDKTGRINLRVSEDLKKAFDLACEGNHETGSAVITRAIVEYVRNSAPPLRLNATTPKKKKGR